jgi:hypothetical protein
LRVRLFSIALLAAGLSACGNDPVAIHASLKFTGAQTATLLTQQLAPSLLEPFGGVLPDPWPASAPPLLFSVINAQRARVDFTTAGGRLPSQSQLVRVRSARASVRAGQDGALAPDPAELLVFVGDFEAHTIDDAGVRRFARGAWPAASDAQDHELSLEPGADGALADLLMQADKLSLLIGVRSAVDTRRDARRPRGSATVDLTLDVELVR